MFEVKPIEIISFIEELNTMGLMLSAKGEELMVTMPDDVELNDKIVEKIKLLKADIIAYLSVLKTFEHNAANNDIYLSNRFVKEGKIYYLLTPTERYWLNNEIDTNFQRNKPTKAFNYIFLNIYGDINLIAIEGAILNFLKRHNSLRSNFHEIDNLFYMSLNSKVNLDDVYQFEDFSQNDRLPESESFIHFSNHDFYFDHGSLIAFRLAKLSEGNFVLSIKIHHIIFDGWSRDLIVRDFFVLYHNVSNQCYLKLPNLKIQIEDYLAQFNFHQEHGETEDRNFWRKKFPVLPSTLNIPYIKKTSTPAAEKICRIKLFHLTDVVIQAIDQLTSEYRVSKFVILQSFFLKYLSEVTKQKDLVIGSYVFGRDLFDILDLIGCFARTVLIRISLKDGDSLDTIIEKVANASNEMRSRIAYPLIKHMEDMLPPGDKIYGSFWKINFNYVELKGSMTENELLSEALKNSDLTISTRKEADHEYLIPIDMQLTFLVNKSKITLEVQYDSSLYEKSAIELFIGEYLKKFNQNLKPIQ